VHTHNLRMGAPASGHEFGTDVRPVTPVPQDEARTFQGFRRADGRAGTRNYLAIAATVNCSADVVHRLCAMLRERALPGFPNVDGIVPITHESGCGMQIDGPAYRVLQRSIWGVVDHPNVAAAMLIGLGCETNQASALLANAGVRLGGVGDGAPLLAAPISIQAEGGVRKALDRGFAEGVRLLERADACRRTTLPLSGLVVGTNCGGSDGNSGISANPALGCAGDEMVRHGAAWLIGETTETYGAEHLLTRRAADRAVGEKLVALMRWWEQYVAASGASIDNNPAPGNKEGGLTTILEKSLGAVSKSGSTPLVAVYDYAERIRHRGFCFMDTPGMDDVSVTGLVAGGCNLMAFTTGRGSCLGFQPTPVLKIATNTELYERMSDDMDLNAGVVLDGTPVSVVGRAIFEELLAVASGKKTKSEQQGLGDHTFAPWALGPVV
jgi:altronate hydrolase